MYLITVQTYGGTGRKNIPIIAHNKNPELGDIDTRHTSYSAVNQHTRSNMLVPYI